MVVLIRGGGPNRLKQEIGVCFFFQAEDGIRDIGVTGVQTCALPISMICGLLRRDGGEVTVAGAALDRDPGQVKAAIGYVPQDVALYPDLSGLENLRFWGRMYGLSGRDLAERVEATLEIVGLTERAGDKVADYSGGMQRRLNIAAGMLHRPRLLVLDEPTVGVDPQSRNAILSNVRSEEHTSELQSRQYLVCRLLLEKKKTTLSHILS